MASPAPIPPVEACGRLAQVRPFAVAGPAAPRRAACAPWTKPFRGSIVYPALVKVGMTPLRMILIIDL